MSIGRQVVDCDDIIMMMDAVTHSAHGYTVSNPLLSDSFSIIDISIIIIIIIMHSSSYQLQLCYLQQLKVVLDPIFYSRRGRGSYGY